MYRHRGGGRQPLPAALGPDFRLRQSATRPYDEDGLCRRRRLRHVLHFTTKSLTEEKSRQIKVGDTENNWCSYIASLDRLVHKDNEFVAHHNVVGCVDFKDPNKKWSHT
ncbi:Protein of unknown function [Gryllus bimaculatus]|nr:Protein of unknown function [Gryllus bimaculatus]